MIDMRHSRGIATFIVRFLLFYMVALLVFSFPLLPVLPGLTFLFSCGLMGFFTFTQVMASISRKFLDQPVAWKAAAIAVAIVFDGAVLWLFGLLLVVVFDGGSAWFAVTEWLPSHVFAALCAWGLREIIHALGSRKTAAPSALDAAAEPADSASKKDTDALRRTPTSAKADASDDR
ncbi:hypothetical protein [Cellulomonas flavigena]|uniref:hypothetical protein n=1 Tax=Cellulomonas flavigena TaxID=1711 RepID=UPI000660F105|nr:hypothetical protein [Cellulomonas flavigena]